jgi:hypothetical protein
MLSWLAQVSDHLMKMLPVHGRMGVYLRKIVASPVEHSFDLHGHGWSQIGRGVKHYEFVGLSHVFAGHAGWLLP